MKLHIPESILDEPREDLCPEVWNTLSQPPKLLDTVQQKIDKLIDWTQSKYHFNDLSVYIIGSICSNSYSEDSDIDIDFCASGMTEDDNDAEAVKDFGWRFKKSFIEEYASQNPEDVKAGSHPFEVYFNPNPFQCFMSIGCYNVLDHKWEVGPDLEDSSFDPVSEYYADAMKQVKKILEDIRAVIFGLYEDAFACKKSNDNSFKDQMKKDITEKLEDAVKLYDQMKKVRSNFQRPCKSKEEALKRREDKTRHVVDAAFKFLEKFGYIFILKDFVQLWYDFKEDKSTLADIDSKILSSVSSNMQLKHLQDSESIDDQKFLLMMQEVESMLNESMSNLVKVSFIATLMAISGLLPANALTKTLTKAKQQNSHLTVNSKETKKAIMDASTDQKMIGEMSKTNLVNLAAQVLWKEARGEKIEGIKAVASVILNRTGNDPIYIVPVLKQPSAFECLENYTGGWKDSDYKWYFPYNAITSNPANKQIWDDCNKIALQLVDKTFKSTIGNRNAYLNKKTAKKKALNTWGKKCDLKVGNHHFGYLKENDPKYVVPGTYTSWKKHNAQQNSIAKTVAVQSGDTLSKIAKAHNMTLAEILKLNQGIKDPNNISIGQKIRIA